MSNKVGFLGCGKSAKAVINGCMSANLINNNDILASTHTEKSAFDRKNELNINVITDNKSVVEFADIIFIAVKPNQVEEVLKEIQHNLTNEKLIISFAAGVSIKKIELYSNLCPVIRVMPNTPVLVKEGICATAKGTYATDSHEKIVHKILSEIGKVISVEENQIDVVTAISGSGPAFFYQIFEDMAQAGVELGLDYDKSLMLAVQTALGSAKMVFNRTKSVNELISSVATKGGCTEVGINTMHNLKSDELFYEIIKNTTQKASQLG